MNGCFTIAELSLQITVKCKHAVGVLTLTVHQARNNLTVVLKAEKDSKSVTYKASSNSLSAFSVEET